MSAGSRRLHHALRPRLDIRIERRAEVAPVRPLRATCRIAQSQKNGSANGRGPRWMRGVPSAPLRIAARRSSRTPASAPARIRAASAPVRNGGPDETATALAPCPRGAPPPRSPSRAPACRTTRSRRPRSPPDSSRTAHGSYCETIQSLSCRRSIWSARNASTYFQASVRGCGTMRRAACIVIVEAPEIRRRCVMFCTHARRTLGTLTPQWRKKRRSSLATSAFTIQSSVEAT